MNSDCTKKLILVVIDAINLISSVPDAESRSRTNTPLISNFTAT